jgi:divalent metal cation (Fe/Co/Zn/Cd) transporter
LLAESFVEALLVAGIAGAGLVLTAFSLGVSQAEGIMRAQVTSLANHVKKLRETPVTETTSKVAIRRRQRIENQVLEKQGLPAALDLGFNVIAFVGFVGLAFFCFLWLVSENYRSSVQMWLLGSFVISIICFLTSGVSLIWNTHKVISTRFEEEKREVQSRTEMKAT